MPALVFDPGFDFDSETFDVGAIYARAFQDYDTGVVSNSQTTTSANRYGRNDVVTYDQTLVGGDGTSTVIHVTDDSEYPSYAPASHTITISSVAEYYGDKLLYTLTDSIDETNRGASAYTTAGFYAASDTITAGGDKSTIIAGAGDDFITAGSGTNYIAGQAGNDTLIGGNGPDHLEGDDGDDILVGGNGPNYLDGGAGNDTLYGGPSTDVFIGGAGYDSVYYAYAATGLVVSLTDPTQNTGEAAGDTFSSIEAIGGSAFADTLIGDAGANTLLGLGGDDILIGAAGDDVLDGGTGNNQLYGGAGNDTLITGSGNSLLYGDEGDDTLIASGGSNYLFGGAGADTLSASGTLNYLDGGAGGDQLQGGSGFAWAAYQDAQTGVKVNPNDMSQNTGDAAGDTYYGVNGVMGTGFADTLMANSTVQTLAAYGGDDTLVGAGYSTLYGGPGSDTYFVTGMTDQIVEDPGEGLDTVFSTGSYVLPDNTENLILQGNAVTGIGNANDNVVVGNALNNVLLGGAGNDELVGGAGKDTFVFRTAYGHDRIDDFQAAGNAPDVVQIDPALASSFADVMAKASDIGTASLITFDAATSLLLLGVKTTQLTASNFAFG